MLNGILPIMHKFLRSTIGTGKSVTVTRCQVCDAPKLKPILFLGYLPPVNSMPPIGEFPHEQPSYPALFLQCPKCTLLQLGLIVDPQILFPPEYPYTSGTTKVLRDNFADLAQEVQKFIPLTKNDLVLDIGSNDGTLLSNFMGVSNVFGIEPSNVGTLAIAKNIPTEISYFDKNIVQKVTSKFGRATLITATNVFAHIEHIHEVIENVLSLLKPNGIFVTESHYAHSLIETLQYDAIYHEHLRYYSLTSLSYLLKMHGLKVFHVKRIPSHGGSIRVYASRPGKFSVQPSVKQFLNLEKKNFTEKRLTEFAKKATLSKLKLNSLLSRLKSSGKNIVGVGAPSRATTLINYASLDEGIVNYIVEVKS